MPGWLFGTYDISKDNENDHGVVNRGKDLNL